MPKSKTIEPSEKVEPVDAMHVHWRGQKLVYFGGCDYHRLSWHPAIRRAITKTLETGPVGVGASRFTTGNHPVYGRVEALVARFFAAPSATLVPSGYLTNLMVAQALNREFEHVLIDHLAHPTLHDAAKLMSAKIAKFRHADARDFANCLDGIRGRVLVMTDAVYAHNGELAPLAEYAKVLPRNAMMLVDDCHGAGVLGERGAGSIEHWGLKWGRIIQTITFSKAYGVAGGAIIGSKTLRRKLMDRSEALSGSTPLAPALAMGIDRAVRILDGSPSRLRRLRDNTRRVFDALELPGGEFPVFVIECPTAIQIKRLSAALTLNGIHPPFIHYHGKEQGFFRFAISSEHPREELDTLVRVLKPFVQS